jgi:DNA-binding LacI/PurR family transcriptional regulator
MKVVSRKNHQLLHRQIKDAILKEYSDCEVRESMPFPSVRELVRKFDTSIVTIGKTLKELKKDGIIYSVPDVGTFWGKQRHTTRYWTVGVRFAVASLAYITPDTYYFHMLQGIESVFEKCNFHTKLLRYESVDSIDRLRELHCDAIICTGTHPPVLTAVENFRRLNLPYLLLDRPNADETLNYLERDSADNLEELVAYLASLGHRKICCVGLEPKLWIDEKLYRGFESGMRKQQLDIAGSMLKLPDFSRESIAGSGLKEIMRKHSAMIILNPLKDVVGAILEYCQSNRIKIPEDCSLVSLAASGDMKIGDKTVTCHLITPYEMGKAAADGIMKLLNNAVDTPFHIKFPLNIIKGDTTLNQEARKNEKQLS